MYTETRLQKESRMKAVTLKNGSEEANVLVTVTMMSLRRLMKEKPIIFYELVMKCRDSNHQFFGKDCQDLERLNLVQPDGRVHDSIRNIVLSAAIGDGLEMRLGSPIKEG